MATPEATCRIISVERGDRVRALAREFGLDPHGIYFKDQRHSSLVAFLGQLDDFQDDTGAQSVVMTYSPLSQDVVTAFKAAAEKECEGKSESQKKSLKVTHMVLHEIDQERILRHTANDFFKNAVAGSTLLVQCDPLATSKRRIEHAKFVIESARSKFIKQAKDAKVKAGELAMAGQAMGGATEEKRGAMEEKGRSRESDPPFLDSEDGSDAKADVEFDGNHAETMNETDRQGGGERDVVEGQDGLPLPPTSAYREKRSAADNVNVIILLHLPRGEVEGDCRYCVDFDTRWHFAFVDSIFSAESMGLPDVETMIGKSMLDVLSGLDTKKLLLKSFRSSLSSLVFPHERTNGDLIFQIKTIIKALDDVVFVDAVKVFLNAMLVASPKTESNFELDADDRLLLIAGTFQGKFSTTIWKWLFLSSIAFSPQFSSP